MNLIFLILSLIIIVFVIDGQQLIKGKQWKEFTIFALLLAAALLLQIGDNLGLPPPVGIMDKLIHPLGKAVLHH